METLEQLSVRNRKHWETILRTKLIAAEKEYKAVSKSYAHLMATAADVGASSPDGCAAIEQAIAMQRLVLDKYQEALREFADLVHRGKVPGDITAPAREPGDAVEMTRLRCEGCEREVLAKVAAASATGLHTPDAKCWICAVCGGWIRNID